MPRRGSLVGDAYVRIHADSSAIDNELRREFSAASKKTAKGQAREFITNLDKEIRKEAKGRVRRSNEELIRGIVGGKTEWDRQFKSSGLASVDEFVKKVRGRLQRIEKVSGKKSIKQITVGLQELDEWAKKVAENDALERRLKKTGEAAKKAAAELKALGGDPGDVFDKMLTDDTISRARAQNKKFIEAIVGGKKEWEKQFRESGIASLDEFVNDVESRLTRLRQVSGRRARVRIDVGLDSLNTFRIEETTRAIERQDAAFRSYGSNLIRRTNPAFIRFLHHVNTGTVHVGRFNTIFGKAFGKGSRNNFLNFVGTVAQGVATIGTGTVTGIFRSITGSLELATIAGRGFYDITKGIGQLFSGGGFGGVSLGFKNLFGDLGEFGKSIGPLLGGALKSGAGAIAAIAAALVALAVVVPPVLSLLGSLVGILTALAGSFTIGVIGGLLALAPVLLAVGGGVGTLIALFASLDSENKTLMKNLKPLTTEWGKLVKFFKKGPMEQFTKALGELAPLVKQLKPFITGFSDAIYAVILRLATLFSAKDMQPFIKAFQKTLPGIFEDMGQGLAVLLAGLVKFFKPILPFAERLAHNFERLMTTFSDWAGSAEGQNAIADFMENAWEKANDVWNIIVLLGQAIGGIFSAGDKNAGGDFLKDIQTNLQSFVDWINSPDGQQGLKDFFTNAKTTAETLWQALVNIGNALKTIDWEDAAKNANAAIDFVGKLISGIVGAIAVVNAHIEAMGLAWQAVGDFFITIYNATLGPVLSLILGAFSGIVRYIADMLDALANVPGFEWAKTAATNLRGAASQADAVGDAIRRIPHTWEVTIQVGVSNATAGLLKGINDIGGSIQFGASGGILTGPTFVRSNVVGGEAGREALVPLDRPLHMVDPSVRALSAFAQGLGIDKGARGGTLGSSGPTTVVESGAIMVTVPNSDPEQVASAVLDRMVIATAR